MMLQLEDILLLVFLQLQSTLLSGQTRFRCLLFAHEGGAARRLRDPDTRQSGFLQQQEEGHSRYFLVHFIDKNPRELRTRETYDFLVLIGVYVKISPPPK